MWLIELAPVRDPDDVVDAFAAVFGMTARAGQTLEEALVEFFGAKQLLLVVDNCEHVLGRGRRPGRGDQRARARGWSCWRRAARAWRSTANASSRCPRWRLPGSDADLEAVGGVRRGAAVHGACSCGRR